MQGKWEVRFQWKEGVTDGKVFSPEMLIPGYNPQFVSNKPIFYNYYRLFIDYFHQYY